MTKKKFFLLLPLFLTLCSCASSMKTAESDQSVQAEVGIVHSKEQNEPPQRNLLSSFSVQEEKEETWSEKKQVRKAVAPRKNEKLPHHSLQDSEEKKTNTRGEGANAGSLPRISNTKLPTSFWSEIFVQTEQSVGAYSFSLEWDPKHLRLKQIKGGHSSYFSSPPWTREIGPNTLEISSFHGSQRVGPSGTVSLCLLEWEGEVSVPKIVLQKLSQVQTQASIPGELFVQQHSQKPTLVLDEESPVSTETLVEVWLHSDFPLKGYLFTLRYDPQFIHIQEVQGGGSFYFSSPPFSAPETYPSGSTKISAYHGATEGPTGKISLCKIFFKKIQSGQTTLTLTDSHWIDLQGKEQVAEIELVPETLELK